MRINATDILSTTQSTNIGTALAHVTANGSSHANVVAATNALAAGKGPGHLPTATQAVLADATIQTYIMQAAGTITGVGAFIGTAVTGDRTHTVDVKIGGVSVFTGATPIMLNAAATTTVVEGTINAAANTFAKGSVVTVVVDYTAGTGAGGADLSVTIGYQLT